MLQLPDGVYDSVGIGEDAVDEVPHQLRDSTGNLNSEPQRQPEGVYDTLGDERSTEYERPFRSADAASEEHVYIELPQPPDSVYDSARFAGNTEYKGQNSVQTRRQKNMSTSSCHHSKASTRRLE